jgi:aspartate racemase
MDRASKNLISMHGKMGGVLSKSQESNERCLGLIGGLGVGATIHYYKELVKEHSARGQVPNLVIVHADVNRVLRDAAAGDTRQLAAYLAELLEQLSSGGAKIAAIPSVTPHICMAELVELSPIPLVSLPAAILSEIQTRQLKRVALFGTRFTMESRMFGQLPGVEVVVPRPDEVDLIHVAYVQIVNAGCGTEEHYQGLRAIAHALCERERVEAVVLAGTELSLIFNETNTDFPHIDGARVHLAAIMRDLLAG